MVDVEPVNSTQRLGSSAAESTTLVTFLLNDVRKAHRVELFGSWDNFSIPYPMVKDSRRGRGHWRGIHTFKNIICDGDLSQDSTSNRRDGALLAGGLYWYYYRLNGDVEYYNPAEPSTNNCPLLPGQTVNLLEVPLELPSRKFSEASNLDPNSVMTWNPEDRWAPLKRKRGANVTTLPKSTSTPQVKRPQTGKLRRLRTSGGQLPGLSSGFPVATTDGARSSRPKSCPSIVSTTTIPTKSSRPRRSLQYSRPQSRDDMLSSRADTGTRRGSSRPKSPANPFQKLQKRSAVPKAIPEFLRVSRHLPSRARTAHESGVAHAWPTDASKSFFTRTPQRPSSAPSTFAPVEPPPDFLELSDSDKIRNRMRSLRLRIACAKLRKLQNEDTSFDPVDTSWILNSLPDSFSEVLQNFRGRQDTGAGRENRGSLNSDELSTSPPQLSFSSRQSTLWTPETASILGTSDGFGPSLQMAIRNSVDFQVAVHDAIDLETPPVQDSPKAANKAADRLGVRFSGVGLDSQETIKPPRTHDSPVKPLDPAWNPFDERGSASHEEQAVEQQGEQEFLPKLTEGLNSDGLMDDLGFLGKAIA